MLGKTPPTEENYFLTLVLCSASFFFGGGRSGTNSHDQLWKRKDDL